MILFLFIIILFGFAYNFRQVSGHASNNNISSFQQNISLNKDELWKTIQTWRVNQGLNKYNESADLCEIANDRANDGYDGHRGFVEKYYNSRPYILSENITQAGDASSALLNWLNSPSHHAALEKDYKYSCVATNGDYAVQIFSNLGE